MDPACADGIRHEWSLGLMGHFMKGTQGGEDTIRMERSPCVIVTAVEGVLPAHADGETLCTEGLRMELEILSNGLEILTESAE
jgi:diacylglycerol kinase (ATP)